MKQLIGLFFLIISACSQQINSPALHDLGLVGFPIQVSNKPMATITVSAPEWLRDYRIHYRLLYNQPTQVRFYTLDRWLAPLPELFQERLQSGGLSYAYPLDIELLAFEQQFTSSQQATVVMHFNVQVYSNNHNQRIISKQFLLRQNSPNADAKGAVTAFANLSHQAIFDVSNWLNTVQIDSR